MTPEQRQAALAIVNTIQDAVDAAGKQGVPSGHLYAALMGIMSLDTYQQVSGALKQRGSVTERHHCLYSTKS